MCLFSLLPNSLLIKWLLQTSMLEPLVSHLFCQVLQRWGDDSYMTEGYIFYVLLKYLIIRHPFTRICRPHSGDQPRSLVLAVQQGLILVTCQVLGADTLGFRLAFSRSFTTARVRSSASWRMLLILSTPTPNQEWVGKSPAGFVTNNNIRSPAGRRTHYSHTLGHFGRPGSQQAHSAAYICHVWEVRAQSAPCCLACEEEPGLRSSSTRQNHNWSSSSLWISST